MTSQIAVSRASVSTNERARTEFRVIRLKTSSWKTHELKNRHTEHKTRLERNKTLSTQFQLIYRTMKWQFKEDHTYGNARVIHLKSSWFWGRTPSYCKTGAFRQLFTFQFFCFLSRVRAQTVFDPSRSKMKKYTLDQRVAESQKIRQKYPDRIPVIVQKVENSNIEKIDKRKYLVRCAWVLDSKIFLARNRPCSFVRSIYCIDSVARWKTWMS